MKKYLLWLPLVSLILGVTIYSQKKECLGVEKTASKSISLTIYKSNTYASKIYNSTSVKLQITIKKISDKNHTIVLSKNFDEKLLKHYPDSKNALFQKVIVSGAFDKKEHLEVSYILSYNSNGSELQMHNDTIICDSDSKLDISI